MAIRYKEEIPALFDNNYYVRVLKQLY